MKRLEIKAHLIQSVAHQHYIQRFHHSRVRINFARFLISYKWEWTREKCPPEASGLIARDSNPTLKNSITLSEAVRSHDIGCAFWQRYVGGLQEMQQLQLALRACISDRDIYSSVESTK
jgi:hypothetical protein